MEVSGEDASVEQLSDLFVAIPAATIRRILRENGGSVERAAAKLIEINEKYEVEALSKSSEAQAKATGEPVSSDPTTMALHAIAKEKQAQLEQLNTRQKEIEQQIAEKSAIIDGSASHLSGSESNKKAQSEEDSTEDGEWLTKLREHHIALEKEVMGKSQSERASDLKQSANEENFGNLGPSGVISGQTKIEADIHRHKNERGDGPAPLKAYEAWKARRDSRESAQTSSGSTPSSAKLTDAAPSAPPSEAENPLEQLSRSISSTPSPAKFLSNSVLSDVLAQENNLIDKIQSQLSAAYQRIFAEVQEKMEHQEKELQELRSQKSDKEREIAGLKETNAEQEKAIQILQRQLRERDDHVARLQKKVNEGSLHGSGSSNTENNAGRAVSDELKGAFDRGISSAAEAILRATSPLDAQRLALAIKKELAVSLLRDVNNARQLSASTMTDSMLSSTNMNTSSASHSTPSAPAEERNMGASMSAASWNMSNNGPPPTQTPSVPTTAPSLVSSTLPPLFPAHPYDPYSPPPAYASHPSASHSTFPFSPASNSFGQR